MKSFNQFIVEKAVNAKKIKELDQVAGIIIRDKGHSRKFNKMYRYGKQKEARLWYTKVTGHVLTPEEGDYLTVRLIDKIKAP
jgi:hypothetical protein